MSTPPSPALRVLVAYASKYGSTGEIARALGDALAEAGLAVTVAPAAEIRSLSAFDAVVLGSGLYSATWLREANTFIRAQRRGLERRPLWLFSSGPLDHSAEFTDLPLTPHAAEVLGDVRYRGHRTFGGRLLPDAPEVLAGLMSPLRVGDFRDFDRIRAWGREIAAALIAAPGDAAPRSPAVPPSA